jgi:hypothetical protein
MAQDWNGMQVANPKDDLKQQITELGIEHRLMTQFTSFVAVEDQTVTTGGEPQVIQVPVEMPKGVSYEGVFGVPGRIPASGAVVGGSLAKMQVMNGRFSTAETVEVTSAAPPINVSSSSVTTTFNGATYPFIRTLSDLGPLYDKNEPKDSDSKRSALERKLDATLLVIWECHALTAGKVHVPEGCSKLPQESVHVEVTVSKASEQLLLKLRGLGFVIDPHSKRLIGIMPIQKLNKLAAVPEVIFVKFIPEAAHG